MISLSDRRVLEAIAQAAPPDANITFNLGERNTASFSTISSCFRVNLSNILELPDNSDLEDDELAESFSIKFALSADKLRSAVCMMPPEKEISITVDKYRATFKCMTMTRTMSLIDAEDSVQVEMNGDVEECVLASASEFVDCLSYAVQCVHKDEVLPVGNVLLTVNGDTIKFIGADNKVLALVSYTQKIRFLEGDIAISPSHVLLINKLCSLAESSVIFSIDEMKKIKIASKLGHVIFAQPLIKFVDMTAMVDKFAAINSDIVYAKSAKRCVVSTKELKQALSHANAIFSKNEFSFVDITIEPNSLALYSQSKENSTEFSFSMEVESEAVYNVRLSPMLLSKALGALGSKAVTIAWKSDADSTQPLGITNPSEDRLFLVSGMLVRE